MGRRTNTRRRAECTECGRAWPAHLNAEDCADQDRIELASDLTVRTDVLPMR